MSRLAWFSLAAGLLRAQDQVIGTKRLLITMARRHVWYGGDSSGDMGWVSNDSISCMTALITGEIHEQGHNGQGASKNESITVDYFIHIRSEENYQRKWYVTGLEGSCGSKYSRGYSPCSLSTLH